MFTLFLMIFFHIVDDYYLQQGLLSSMKQRKWWREHPQYKEIYKYDYLVALIIHAFSWSFMIMLPIAFHIEFSCSWLFCGFLLGNMIVHAIVDHLKANRLCINLLIDQSIHLMQIVITYLVFMI